VLTVVRLGYVLLLDGRSKGYRANAAPPSIAAMKRLDATNAVRWRRARRQYAIAIAEVSTIAGIIHPMGHRV
jgi:hypothetical protein